MTSTTTTKSEPHSAVIPAERGSYVFITCITRRGLHSFSNRSEHPERARQPSTNRRHSAVGGDGYDPRVPYKIRRCPICGNALPRLQNRRTKSGRSNPQARCRTCKEYICGEGHVIWWPSYEARAEAALSPKTAVCTHPACVVDRVLGTPGMTPEEAAALEVKFAPTEKPKSSALATFRGYPMPERMREEVIHRERTAAEEQAEDREAVLEEIAGLLGTEPADVPEELLGWSSDDQDRLAQLRMSSEINEYRLLDAKRRYWMTGRDWERWEAEVSEWWDDLASEWGMAEDLARLNRLCDEWVANPHT